jgi:hypothetical protein
MFRSVTKSEQSQQDSRRVWRWAEGVLIGLAVFLITFFAFGWFAGPPMP